MPNLNNVVALNADQQVEIDTLGMFAVRHLGSEISIRGRKTRAMLAYLAMAPSAKASRQRIADLLWSDRGEEQARGSLRQALAEARGHFTGSAMLRITRTDIGLCRDTLVTDIERILRAADRADSEGLARCLERVDGGFLDDLTDIAEVFDEWASAERSRQHDLIVTRSLKALDYMHESSTLADLHIILRALDRLDPFNEAVARLGMKADHANGDIASLHRRYRRLEDGLTTEFATQPSAATRDLLHELTSIEKAASSLKAGETDAASDKAAAPIPTGLPMIMVSPLSFSADDRLGAELADLCTEDIRAELTRHRDLRVIALETPDIERVVGVCKGALAAYMMSGRIRRSGDDLRINLQIGHIGDTVLIWSERLAVPLGELSDAVAQIVARAVGAVDPVIGRDLSSRFIGADIDQGDGVALYAKARAVVKDRGTLDDAQRGAAMLHQVVEDDPRHVGARLLLAQLYNTDFWQQMAGHDVAAHRAKAQQLVAEAAKIDPENVRVRTRLAWCHLRAGDWAVAERMLQSIMDAAPLDADAMNESACACYHIGELEKARSAMQRAFMLNPFPPSDYHADYAIIEALSGNHKEAEEHFAVAGEQSLQYLAVRIANLASLPDQHRQSVSLARQFQRSFDAAWQGATAPDMDDICAWLRYTLPLWRPEHEAVLCDGLVAALNGIRQS